jgi:tetratricopeptide (TPR) repeat protein
MSSILFVVGTVVGERLLYIPSAALVFVLASMATSMSAKSQAWRVGFVPGFAVLWVVWGVRCYYRTIDWADSEAITIADGLRQLKSSRTQFNLGNYYLKRNELDLALAAYDRSIKADPLERDASPLWHAGQIHILRGNWQAAEDTLRKAVNGYFSPLVLPEEEVFHDLGLACYRTKKEEEAIYYIQAAVTTNPMLSKGWNNLACTMVGAGLSHSNQQVVLEGLQAIDRAIQINPSNVLYWRNAAILLYMVGDQQASVNAFNQVMALEQNPAAQMSPECVWEFYLR